MRIAIIPLVFALGIAPTQAAPVPTPGASPEIRSRFDQLWEQSSRSEADVVRLQCYLETLSLKERLPLLRGKMQPVQLSERLAKAWIKDLSSDDEKIWKEAEAKLRKLDVRLAMDITDAWELAENDQARRRLAASVNAVPVEKYGPLGNYTLSLHIRRAGYCLVSWAARDNLPVEVFPRGKGSHSWLIASTYQNYDLSYDAWSFSRKQLGLASEYVLRDDPNHARVCFGRVAAGHPGVGPTVDAKRALARLDWGKIRVLGYSITPKPAKTDLGKLWGPNRDGLANLDATRKVLADPKTSIAFLKTKLKPQSMKKEEALDLLEAYLGEDREKAQKALGELQIRDFRLAIPLTEAWGMAKDVRSRRRIVAYDKPWGAKTVEGIDALFPKWDFRLTPPRLDQEYWLAESFLLPELGPIPNEGQVNYAMHDTLEGRYWDYSREEIGLVWLEAIDTPEAWELIRSISKGNPKASLTTFAQKMLVGKKR